MSIYLDVDNFISSLIRELDLPLTFKDEKIVLIDRCMEQLKDNNEQIQSQVISIAGITGELSETFMINLAKAIVRMKETMVHMRIYLNDTPSIEVDFQKHVEILTIPKVMKIYGKCEAWSKFISVTNEKEKEE